jgi:hypothetical protein
MKEVFVVVLRGKRYQVFEEVFSTFEKAVHYLRTTYRWATDPILFVEKSNEWTVGREFKILKRRLQK